MTIIGPNHARCKNIEENTHKETQIQHLWVVSSHVKFKGNMIISIFHSMQSSFIFHLGWDINPFNLKVRDVRLIRSLFLVGDLYFDLYVKKKPS
jgi:hypothetical protein